ncbi:MAG: dihydroorotase, partial [Bacteroidia bacterium]
MKHYLIKNARIVNEGKIVEGDVLIKGERIEKIGKNISHPSATVIDASGKYLLPGIIDDQVHFREPGLTHKADIYTESKAAVAGGITTYMEMPNVDPQTITQKLLEEKYQLGAQKSLANFSFYIGATNNNLEELLKTDPKNVCGIKIFMGSSTGNMLVDDRQTLEGIFSQSPLLIATHCEDEHIIKKNIESFRKIYGEEVPLKYHP